MNKTKYWYKTTVYYCPVCCSESKTKERQYVFPKPLNTIVLKQVYDWCEI
mgnify:CR=1 FL=1